MESHLSPPQAPRPASSFEPRVISRAEHPISRKHIEPEPLRVLVRLHQMGHKAYLVGGAVRDLYMGKPPKDYDVGTDARPSRLKRLFRHCRIIGRRFRIAHVWFPGDKVVEVTTFRRSSESVLRSESGVILRDNEYGTPQEDALRRDLTINGLFYDIATFSIIDYVGGVQDIEDRIIRTIADPDESFREDPVRMVRALRHAARTGFQVEENTLEAIYRNHAAIVEANPSRLLEEIFKDLRSGASEPFFRSLLETGLLDSLVPGLARQLRALEAEHPFWGRLAVVDRRAARGEAFSNQVLLCVLFHTLLFPEREHWTDVRRNPGDVWRYLHGNLRDMPHGFRISRRDVERVAQILIGFGKLWQGWRKGRLPGTLAAKTYLAEALDFFRVDLEARGLPLEQVDAWRNRAAASEPPVGSEAPAARRAQAEEKPRTRSRSRSRRRRERRKRH